MRIVPDDVLFRKNMILKLDETINNETISEELEEGV
jgi:hypothetical protein